MPRPGVATPWPAQSAAAGAGQGSRQQDHLLAALEPELRPVDGVTAEEAAVLGEAQDNALLLRHCGPHSPFPPPLRKLLRAKARARLGRARTLPATASP